MRPKFKKNDIVLVRTSDSSHRSDGELVGLVKGLKSVDSTHVTYDVNFMIHSNVTGKDQEETVELDQNDLVPARINFGKLHHMGNLEKINLGSHN